MGPLAWYLALRAIGVFGCSWALGTVRGWGPVTDNEGVPLPGPC